MQHEIFLGVAPRAASRTRCACRGRFPSIYNDPAYAAWLKDAITKLEDWPGRPPVPSPSDVWASVEARVRRPKKTVKVRPSGDADNHLKGVFDALTQAGWWKDDDQVVETVFLKRWAVEDEAEGYRIILRFRDAG